jgi:Sulfotransferase domain
VVLPNLVVIGAQKAGTSSLHLYLKLHPEIAMSAVKELNYFSGPGWNWERGLEWYSEQFRVDAPVRGESSPSYAAYPYTRGVPERMASIIPDARLIYLVRDPVERMVSAYAHRRSRGYEQRDIEEVFTDPLFSGSGYVAQSRYATQLTRYLEHFEAARVLVVDRDDLLNRRPATLRRIFRFLEVNEAFTSPRFEKLSNTMGSQGAGSLLRRRTRRVLTKVARHDRRAVRPQIDDELRVSLLNRLFAEEVARLRELTGQPFASWRV